METREPEIVCVHCHAPCGPIRMPVCAACHRFTRWVELPKVPWVLNYGDRRFLHSIRVQAD